MRTEQPSSLIAQSLSVKMESCNVALADLIDVMITTTPSHLLHVESNNPHQKILASHDLEKNISKNSRQLAGTAESLTRRFHQLGSKSKLPGDTKRLHNRKSTITHLCERNTAKEVM